MTAAEIFTPQAAAIKPADFIGQYAFCHDGWPGTLTLEMQGGRNLRGTYRDERLAQTFVVIGKVDSAVRNKVTLTIRDFNWLDEQVFIGYLFSRSREAMAGTTLWRDEPFGFLATKAPALTPEVFRSGGVQPDDFAGCYDLVHDGITGSVELEHTEGRLLSGRLDSTELGRELAVHGEVDAAVPHQVSLRLGGDLRLAAVRFTGYLFSRPKNTVAGVIESAAGTTGFYMVKRP
ncbi:hypothetical protein ABZ379_31635 [Streptomyces canus]|uniref:hypothetical protein n=1 Tax=Streptomyces canus TaxID=58343 RepID=UPI0033DD2854